jgi:iron(III) transport system ATP-binding protein
MAEIRLADIRKRFRSVTALQAINLTVRNGELLALLGPSGCGKTTTLQILAGFLAPDGGEVWADDRLLSSPRGVIPPEHRRMSLVFQSYALWPHMTVFQNVAFGLEMHRLPPGQIARRVTRILEVVGLAGFDARYPHELSGGQQQRVALARALVVEPDTLLLDEPLSNLDANLREQMRFEIRRIHEETRITTIYVTHDQAEAMVIADRIAVMNVGRIEQIGPPRAIYEAPQSRFVASFIGQANCLPGRLVESGRIRCGDLEFQMADASAFRPGDEVVLCIRPHAVRVHGTAPYPPAGGNTIAGRLVQHAYLGDQQDLRIRLPGGLLIRAFTSSRRSFQLTEQVLVELPAEACRLVRA